MTTSLFSAEPLLVNSNHDLINYKIKQIEIKNKSVDDDMNKLLNNNTDLMNHIKKIEVNTKLKIDKIVKKQRQLLQKIEKNKNQEITMYKELLTNTKDLYYHQLVTFQVILFVIGAAVAILTFVGLDRIHTTIKNKINDIIAEKSDLKFKLLDEKLNEFDERFKKTIDTDFVNQSENNKAMVDMVTKNLSDKKDKTADDWFFLGLEYHNNNNHIDAINSYQKAILLSPRMVNAYTNIGQIHEMNKQNDDAIFYYEKALLLNPNSDSANHGIANIKYIEKDYEEAKSYYLKAIKINPNYYHSFIGIANIALIYKDYEKAIENYNKAYNINPNDMNSILGIANCYSTQKDHKKAIENYNKIQMTDSNNEKSLIGLGNSYFSLEDYNKSKNYFTKAINLNSNNSSAYNGLALIAEKEMNYSEGIKYFEISQQLDPTNILSILGIGKILGEIKNYSSAIKQYIKALNLLDVKKGDLSLINNIYLAIFEIQLLMNQSFEKKFLTAFLENEKNHDNIRNYEMLVIIHNILNRKPYKVELNNWKDKYLNDKNNNWEFKTIEQLFTQEYDKKTIQQLTEVIEIFKLTKQVI